MFGVCSKRLQLLLPSVSISVDSVTHLHKASLFSRLYSSKSLLGCKIDKPKEKDGSFTVSYLVNSCGLSPEVALSLSKKRVHFNSRENPDLVIKLLKDYGFNDTFISQLVKKRPKVLVIKPEETLLPKLEFLRSIGLSGMDIALVLCCNPTILDRNLHRILRPCYDIIKSLHLPDLKIALFFKHYRMCKVRVLSNIVCNVSALRKLEVRVSTLSTFVACNPFILSLAEEKFHENVKKVMSMGIHPSTATTFMRALQVISALDSSKWAQKMEFYRKCGWTEHDFLVAFRKNPGFMQLSEENFSSKIEFIANKMALVQPSYLASHPFIISYSMENRIIPRCSVMKVLLMKGLLTKGDFCLNKTLKYNDKMFVDKIVVPYQSQVPELLGIFQGKVSLVELGIRI